MIIIVKLKKGEYEKQIHFSCGADSHLYGKCSFGANAQKRISEIDFNIRLGAWVYENFWHMGISKVSCDYDSEGRLKTAKFVFSTVLYGNALPSSMQKKPMTIILAETRRWLL